MLKWIVIAVVALAVCAVIYVRHAPENPAEWHVDPARIEPRDSPNDHLVAGRDAVFVPLSPFDAPVMLDRIAQDEPRTGMIAGRFEDGHVTYAQRSAVLAFPDYISIRARPVEGGTRLSLYSRSRFGHSDFGVNRARIERWLRELDARIVTTK